MQDGRCQPPPVTLFLDGDVQHEIEALLAVREARHNKKQFLVKWLGYGPEHNTWEPEANLTNCSEVLQTFWDAARSLEGSCACQGPAEWLMAWNGMAPFSACPGPSVNSA